MQNLSDVLQQMAPRKSNTASPLFPAPESLAASAKQARLLLEPHFTEYTSTVSPAGNPISLECAVLLYVLCLYTAPRRILDLGSGFSSYVFRHYAASTGEGCEVVSVDDSPEWLEKTRSFLFGKGLLTGEFHTWAMFTSVPRHQFDVALHDLGHMGTRTDSLPEVLRYAHPDSYLVLDDLHFSAYSEAVTVAVVQRGAKLRQLREETEDVFGRFACLVYNFAPCSND